MIRIAAYIFGIFFVMLGIWGFIPIIAPHNIVLAYFQVTAFHNLFHLAIGIIALIVGSVGVYASLWFFRIYGIFSLINAILDCYASTHSNLGIIEFNTSDIVLHFVTAAIALYLGFFFAQSELD